MMGAGFLVYSRRALQATLSFVPGADLDIVYALQVPFSAFMLGGETRDALQEQHEANLREMWIGKWNSFYLPPRTMGVI